MVTNGRPELHTLTTDQKNTLLDIINDQLGPDLDFDGFADAVRGLFEDIAGFETIPRPTANRLINQLWRKYNGQTYRQESENACRTIH